MEQTKYKKVRWLPASAIGVAAVVFVLLMSFDREPRHRGKTVTQWLDSMALFEEERRSEQTGQTSFSGARSPQAATNDAALQALLRIGPKGVPTLIRRLAEPADWPPEVSRSRIWLRWKWDECRKFRRLPRPAPRYYCSFQQARKDAAMFTLLALGTNANAGLPAVMEAYAATPKFSSIYGTKVSGTPAGFIPSRIAKMAKSGLPHRREEIIDSITIGLQHTNAQFVALAAEVASGFPEEFGRWKDLLLKLLEHPAEDAQLAALWIAVTTQPGDSDVMRATEAIARDRDNSVLLRGRAAAGLGFAGARATNSLPVMRKLLQHPDSWLKGEVRTAIEMIEKGRPPINEQQPKQ